MAHAGADASSGTGSAPLAGAVPLAGGPCGPLRSPGPLPLAGPAPLTEAERGERRQRMQAMAGAPVPGERWRRSGLCARHLSAGRHGRARRDHRGAPPAQLPLPVLIPVAAIAVLPAQAAMEDEGGSSASTKRSADVDRARDAHRAPAADGARDAHRARAAGGARDAHRAPDADGACDADGVRDAHRPPDADEACDADRRVAFDGQSEDTHVGRNQPIRRCQLVGRCQFVRLTPARPPLPTRRTLPARRPIPVRGTATRRRADAADRALARGPGPQHPKPARPQAVWLHIDAETALAGPLPPPAGPPDPRGAAGGGAVAGYRGHRCRCRWTGRYRPQHGCDLRHPLEPASDTWSEPISDAAADVSSRGGTGHPLSVGLLRPARSPREPLHSHGPRTPREGSL